MVTAYTPNTRDYEARLPALGFPAKQRRLFRLPHSGIGLACGTQFFRRAHVNSTLKIQTTDEMTLIEKIKAELKKRTDLKAKRMLLKLPKRRAKH